MVTFEMMCLSHGDNLSEFGRHWHWPEHQYLLLSPLICTSKYHMHCQKHHFHPYCFRYQKARINEGCNEHAYSSNCTSNGTNPACTSVAMFFSYNRCRWETAAAKTFDVAVTNSLSLSLS